MMDLRQHVGKGIWALIDKSFTGIYGFAVLLLLIAKLPRQEYGIYLLVLAVVNLALLFNKGFILYPMTKFEAEGIPRPRLLGNVFLLSLISMAAFGLLAFLSAPLLAKIFHAPDLKELLKLTPLILMGYFFRDFSLCYLQAHRRVKMLALLDGVYFIGVAAGFGLLNALGVFHKAIMPIWTHMAFAYLSSLVALFPMLKSLKIELRLSIADLKKISRFGRYSLSMAVGEISFYQLDLMLLGYFINPVAVAMYNAAKQPFRLYALLTQSLNILIFPASSHLHARDRLEDIKILFEKVMAYYLSFMLVLNIVLFIGANVIFELIYGGRYPDSVPIFRLFLVFAFIEPLYNISTGVLYGLAKPERAFKPLTIAVPMFIIINLVLIPFIEGMGAAIAFCAANLFMAVRLISILHQELNISLLNSWSYVKRYPKIIRSIFGSLKGDNG